MSTETTSPAGGANPAPSVSSPAPAQPSNAQPTVPGQAAPGTGQAPPVVSQPGSHEPGAASPSPTGEAAAAQQAQGDPSSGQQSDSAEKSRNKVPFQQRISQLVQQRNTATERATAAELRARALEQELQQLKRPLHQGEIDQLTYDQRERLNIQEAVREMQAGAVEREAAQARAEIEEAHEASALLRFETFAEKVNSAADRFPDLLSKFGAKDARGRYLVPVSDVAADFLAESERAAELAHYLASNVEEAHRINRLPVTQQAVALARLEARLQPAQQVRTTSAAPPPPATTLNGGASPAHLDPAQMSPVQYRAWRENMMKARP